MATRRQLANAIRFLSMDAVQKATQMQCSACEEMVRARPEEYFWFHQRFKRFYEKEYKC